MNDMTLPPPDDPKKPGKAINLTRSSVTPSSHSRPVMRKTFPLASDQAQKVCERTFSRTAYSMFSIEVILQIIGEEKSVDKARESIGKLIRNTEDQIDKQIAQITEVNKEHDLDENSAYSNPATYNVDITSPLAMQYAKVLLKFDHMVKMIDDLWMNGYLESRQRSKALHDWRNSISRLSSRIISIEKQARIAAHRRGKQEEVDQTAPTRVDEYDVAASLNEAMNPQDSIEDADALPQVEDQPEPSDKRKPKGKSDSEDDLTEPVPV
ncbi:MULTISPECIES: hypothetical protein [unclassified Pseudomonas]|uniref:hypothetical protein n=1 Tax=unclassified Pseudomonas TaxID=196821 RepID=UPI00257EA4E3|nr:MULTISPECIES: hypothetical protein [unclassified Pseudomonas]